MHQPKRHSSGASRTPLPLYSVATELRKGPIRRHWQFPIKACPLFTTKLLKFSGAPEPPADGNYSCRTAFYRVESVSSWTSHPLHTSSGVINRVPMGSLVGVPLIGHSRRCAMMRKSGCQKMETISLQATFKRSLKMVPKMAAIISHDRMIKQSIKWHVLLMGRSVGKARFEFSLQENSVSFRFSFSKL